MDTQVRVQSDPSVPSCSEPRQEKDGLTLKLFFAVLASWFGSIAMGTVIGYSSPSIPRMETYDIPLKITSDEGDWFGSLMNIGALFGGLAAGLATEKLGRKSTLIFTSAPFVLGYLLIAYANHVSMLLIGRLLTGFCTGVVSLTVPVYVAELSPSAIRGQLSTVIQLSVTIGIVFSFSFGYFLFWTWLAIACTIFPLLMGTIMIFMPETPFWLMKYNQTDEAMKSIRFIRPNLADVNSEFQDLSDAVQRQNSIGSFKLAMLKDPTVYKPLIICLSIMAFQQVCGVNAIVFYTVSIFKNAGSSIDPKLSTIIVGVTQFIGTFGASFIMDKAGRRILLLLSGAGMCVSLGVFGVYYYMVHLKGSDFQTEYGWLPLVSLIVYNLMFAIGYGPIPWILAGEMFPLRAKAFGTGLVTAFNWLCSFIVTKEFSHMIEAFEAFGTYFFFAAVCFASCIFVFFCVPETKGRSFEEIEEQFAGRSNTILNDSSSD
ncbi:Facilitated trehalose transporter Tret1-2 [Nymphon striatum]|nr:Facilitated trehalose transporter Tret1-2 [Nymphon striatum]